MTSLDPSVFVQTPEHALIVAIIAQAVQDLSSPDPEARADAETFWRACDNDLAAHRRDLLNLIGLEEEVVMRHIAPTLPPVEIAPPPPPPPTLPPVDKPTAARLIADRIIENLPDGEFTIHELAERLDMRAPVVAMVIKSLRISGHVRRVGMQRGQPVTWAKTEWLLEVA